VVVSKSSHGRSAVTKLAKFMAKGFPAVSGRWQRLIDVELGRQFP
jgi:hypothetical protein